MKTSLGFIDHHRQKYADVVPIRDDAEAEFMIGDYQDGGGAGPRGEFCVLLKRMPMSRHDASLTVQVQAFDDGFGALREIIALGVLDELERASITHRDDVSEILIDAGLVDRSATPLATQGR